MTPLWQQSLFVLTFSKYKHESSICFEWRVMQEVLSPAVDAFLHCVEYRWGLVYTCCRVWRFWLNLWFQQRSPESLLSSLIVFLWRWPRCGQGSNWFMIPEVSAAIYGWFCHKWRKVIWGGLFTHWQMDEGLHSLSLLICLDLLSGLTDLLYPQLRV